MSATNTTPNIGLPSFIGTDKPSWLTDWNGAMSTIDSEVGGLKTDLSGDETRIGNLENSVSSLNTTVSNHTTSITALNTQVSNQGGTINTITSLIGNGTPTTTDQTIIGAINEINANGTTVTDISSSVNLVPDPSNYAVNDKSIYRCGHTISAEFRINIVNAMSGGDTLTIGSGTLPVPCINNVRVFGTIGTNTVNVKFSKSDAEIQLKPSEATSANAVVAFSMEYLTA